MIGLEEKGLITTLFDSLSSATNEIFKDLEKIQPFRNSYESAKFFKNSQLFTRTGRITSVTFHSFFSSVFIKTKHMSFKMQKSRHCCSITIIAISSFVLLMTIFMTLGGFGLVLRVGLPIGLKMLPVQEELMAWISIPLSITIKAKITEVNSLSAENGTVGGGALAVELEMSKWEEVEAEEGEEPLKLSEFIHIQETAEIDQIQYYKAILSQSTVNYWNFFSWILVLIGVFTVGGATAWRVLTKMAADKNLEEKQAMD